MDTEERKSKQRAAVVRWQERQRLSSGVELIACRVCGKQLVVVDTKHLRLHGMSSAEYATLFPSAPTQNTDVLAARKMTMYKNRYESVALTPTLASFLTGSLLGDGGLEHTSGSRANHITSDGHARYRETAGNRDYLLWKQSFLESHFVTRWAEGLYVSKQTNRTYNRFRLSTHAHPLLGDWYARWYPCDKKIVCRTDVVQYLDALALAVWFYDDGNITRVPRNYSAHLYTLAFLPDDVEWLAQLLVDRFGIDCYQTRVGKHYGIRFRREGRDRLVSIISAYPAPGMAYKLDAPQLKTPWWLQKKE